ncbi:hypothetical protein [Sedimentitalea sp.]|uniref:hypothetical protein n=1 Tax=Sedimentitalea sp. TaxID=2048915 RepID=UPI00329982D2
MKYAALIEVKTGVSRFVDRDAELLLQDFIPPAAPLMISDAITGCRFVFLTLPLGRHGVRHRSPHQQIAGILSGSYRPDA